MKKKKKRKGGRKKKVILDKIYFRIPYMFLTQTPSLHCKYTQFTRLEPPANFCQSSFDGFQLYTDFPQSRLQTVAHLSIWCKNLISLMQVEQLFFFQIQLCPFAFSK